MPPMIDGEIVDTDLSSDALSAEEQAAFDEMRTGEPAKAEPEKPAEPEKEPAAETEPAKAEPEKEPEVQKLVPHGAFEEERQRRKAAQQEAATAREEMARLRGQLDALQAGRQPEGLTPQQKADWDKDPIAAGKALQAELDQQKADAAKSAELRAEHERIAGIGMRHAEKFAKIQPNFHDTKDDKGETVQGAYTFLRIKAAERLQSQYPEASRAQIIEAVNAVERQHIMDSVASGDNAAEALWNMAVEAGYKPPVKAEPKPAVPQKTEAEKVADLEKAQKAAKSLGAVPAGGGETELGIEALANMDDDEFAAATAGGKWEKLHRQGII